MCVNYIGGREMLVMYVSNKISASVILFSYIHFQKAGSPLVQHYNMGVSGRRRDQTSLPESHVTEVYIFFHIITKNG